jgi:DNA repair protein RecN (Recombination protein N)
MLEELRIRGLGVIDDALLEFGPGLTVVTGETGAGKTMVVTGLGLLFGGRADSSRLRAGVDQASVEGRLVIDQSGPVAALVTEAGGDVDEDILVLRRVVSANGRSRSVVGGASVPVSVVGRLSESLLAVHGQSDQQRLTQPTEQRQTLDRYAGTDTSILRETFAEWQRLSAEVERRTSSARELAREAEVLRHGIAEIDAADLVPGEDQEIASAITRLEHADALRVAARSAQLALSGDPDDANGETDVQTLLGVARRNLGHAADTDQTLGALHARLTELAASANDISAELNAYCEQLDADPGRLAELQDRKALLSTLFRKYGPTVESVLAWYSEASDNLLAADTSDEVIAALSAQRDRARAEYVRHATEASAQRRKAAQDLSERITAELAGLAMPAARVTVVVSPRPAGESTPTVTIAGVDCGAGPDGVDDVAITLRPHPDAPDLPVQRGASGGELSRVMLAIEVVLAGTDPVPTMVFDEVDAGVGGRAAVEIGRRLATLAQSHQVIVVTHLAQVAAYADRHLVVDKSVATAGGVTSSDVRVVESEERVAELARMLAGADTPAARQHARELLEASTVDPRGKASRAASRGSKVVKSRTDT